MTLLAEVVAASEEVAASPARSRKVEILAGLLRRVEAKEVPIVAALLSGAPRQGRVGIGYSTVYGIDCPPSPAPSLTVGELDRAVEEVEAASGPGSAGRRRDIVRRLLARATAFEASFIRRLLTGELRQGALEGLMVDAVARAAGVQADLVRRALMLSGDLAATAALALDGGPEALRAVGLELFRPILPMLATSAASVAEALSDMEEASVEWKLDGIRIQAHRRGGEVRLYTRSLRDVTEGLQRVAEAVRSLPVESAVLDGEVLGFVDDETPLTFQETVAKEARAGARVMFFDLLHLDARDLLDAPLRERLRLLERVAPELCIPGVLTSSLEQAQRVLAQALAAGHEGVVVKDASSPYAAGRRGGAWRKVKRYRTFDLVVLAAEWGHGRRRGRLSNLHLGARQGGSFVMVGKCFKGLTDKLLAWQTDELLRREVGRQGIAVFVRPELVVEVAIDGVQVSPRYPGGLALRFARVRRYRPDKRPEDASTLDELRSLLGR